MNSYIVYKITNLKNQKVYIGCHSTKNIDDGYMGSGKLIKSAILKYGLENFKKEILSFHKTEEEMFLDEIKLIKELSPEYNLHEGGNGGWKYFNSIGLSDSQKETRAKNGRAGFQIATDRFKNMLLNESFRENWINKIKLGLSNSNKKNPSFGMLGKSHSNNTLIKMSKAHCGKNNSQYGKKWIYNEEMQKSISVKKTEIDQYISSGWKIGRKMY